MVPVVSIKYANRGLASPTPMCPTAMKVVTKSRIFSMMRLMINQVERYQPVLFCAVFCIHHLIEYLSNLKRMRCALCHRMFVKSIKYNIMRINHLSQLLDFPFSVIIHEKKEPIGRALLQPRCQCH